MVLRKLFTGQKKKWKITHYNTLWVIEQKKGYTFWEKDFDSMAMKTMLRQLISKYGIMSIDMQNAFEGDMAVINEDGSKDYVDNKVEEVEFEIEDVTSKTVSLDEV